MGTPDCGCSDFGHRPTEKCCYNSVDWTLSRVPYTDTYVRHCFSYFTSPVFISKLVLVPVVASTPRCVGPWLARCRKIQIPCLRTSCPAPTFETIDQRKDVVDQPRNRSHLDLAQPCSFFHPGEQVYTLVKAQYAVEGLPRFAWEGTATGLDLQCWWVTRRYHWHRSIDIKNCPRSPPHSS